MLEVALVAEAICLHWQGDRIDRDLVIKVALLHDLGNLIKFRRPFLGELEQDEQFWSQRQDEMRAKYGENVHAATMELAGQLVQDKSLMRELNRTGLAGSLEKFATNEAKIIQLADMCVAPQGIVGPEARIADLLERYQERVLMVDVQRQKENAKLVEKLLDQPLSEILNSISPQDVRKLQQFEI